MGAKIHLISSWLLILLQSSSGYRYDPQKYSIGLFAASALNRSGVREPCVGTCYGFSKDACRLGTKKRDEGKVCNLSNDFLVRHYTKYYHGQTKLCMSDCNNFGYPYTWCVTGNHWSKCSKEIPRNVTRRIPASTKYEYYHCLEGCTNKGQCDIYPESKESCDASKLVYVSDNPTEAGTRCATRCGIWSTNNYMCYDTRKQWVKCYPSPDGTEIVKSFHWYAKKFKYPLDDDGRLKQSAYRRPGDYIDVDDNVILKMESIFSGQNVVEQMAKTLEAIYTTETLPQLREEPILQYTVRIVPTPFDQPQIILPMVVRARYSNFTRRKEKSPFTNSAIVNYRNQNPRPGLDVQGYIVPRALGGTEEPHNIIPLWVGLKQNLGAWPTLEYFISDYIQEHPNCTVEHLVVINYDFTLSNRPMSFGISLKLFDANGRNPRNIYETVFLVNSAGNDI